MALTKVTGSVIKDSVSLSGNVSVGGTLTYQDVTNVDALGIGTFRTGIKVLAGQVDVGSNIKLGNAGVITATSFSGSGANLTGIQVGGASSLSFNDDVNLNFGNSQDLKIYHDGDDSYIDDAGVGSLLIRTITNSNVSIKSSSDFMAKFMTGDAVELYHSGNKKFETTSAGATVTGDLLVSAGVKATTNYAGDDNVKLKLGTGDDLQIYHATAGISTIGHYHSGGEPLHITSNGDIKFKVAAGTGGGGGEDGVIIKSNGAVELYHNNNKKLESTSSGVTVTGGVTASTAAFSGEVDIADGEFLDFGNGGLKIRTNANNAYISEATTGKLEISASNLQLSNAGASQTYAYFTNGGSAALYHAGNASLQTAADGGVKATGNFIVTAAGRGLQFNASDSGSSEILDDYEHNTINLTLTNGGGTPNYSYRAGWYTKIGNVVHMGGDIRFGGSWSGGNNVMYLSLPFTSYTSGGTCGGGICHEWNTNQGMMGGIFLQIDNNTNNAKWVYHNNNGNNNTNDFTSDFVSNGHYLKFTLTYYTHL